MQIEITASFTIELPAYVQNWLTDKQLLYPGTEDRMGLAVALSRLHVRRKGGGPFASAVFDHRGWLVSVGVNRVVTDGCSILHAEIMALALAQKTLGRYDLSDGGRLKYELYATTEPCAMCFGAIPWSGVSRLVCGAREADARGIGFDEGPKPSVWTEALAMRGITVQRDVLREQAVSVLHEYIAGGGIIYNAGNTP